MAAAVTAKYYPGTSPTMIPAEYSIHFSNMNIINNDNVSPLLQQDIMKKQPQVFVSHNEDYELWGESENVTHSLGKFVMTGGTGSLKDELSDAFKNNLVTDFVVTHGLLEDVNNEINPTSVLAQKQPKQQEDQHGDEKTQLRSVEENLVVTVDNPFVSFAARLGNTSSLLFTGISAIKFCSVGTTIADSSNVATTAGATTNISDDTSGNVTDSIPDNTNSNPFDCQVWYEGISVPLYLFRSGKLTVSTSDDDSSNNTEAPMTLKNNVIKRVKSLDGSLLDSIGVINFDFVHEGIGNMTTNTTEIIEEHMKHMKRIKGKRMSILITIVLAVIAIVLIFKAWTAKYGNYQRL